jgi:hypothetical protein
MQIWFFFSYFRMDMLSDFCSGLNAIEFSGHEWTFNLTRTDLQGRLVIWCIFTVVIWLKMTWGANLSTDTMRMTCFANLFQWGWEFIHVLKIWSHSYCYQSYAMVTDHDGAQMKIFQEYPEVCSAIWLIIDFTRFSKSIGQDSFKWRIYRSHNIWGR